MGLEHGAYRPAEIVIVLERLDFFHFAERVKGGIIQVVHLVDVRVRDHDIGQLLHVADPVSDPEPESSVNTTVQRREREREGRREGEKLAL